MIEFTKKMLYIHAKTKYKLLFSIYIFILQLYPIN